MRTSFLLLSVCALAGCRSTPAALPLPFTAQQMVQTGTGRALAHYLTQPDATSEVCSRTSKGPHVGALSKDDIDQLIEGLMQGTVPPPAWQKCAKALLTTAPQ